MRLKKRILDSWNWARSRFAENSAILLYHRVASRERDHFGLCVSPENFAEQIGSLAAIATPLPLGEFIAQNRRAALPPRSIAITFDDGYLDVMQNALPILERHEIPATIFIVTGNFGKPFWWDRLTDLIVYSPQLPESIRLGGATFATAGQSRRRLLKAVYPGVRSMEPGQRDERLAELAAALGHPNMPIHERSMTPAELRSLAAHPLITLGAHTVTHPQLASLDRAAQAAEIVDSVRQLEAAIGQPVKTFSYPFGIRSRDYNAETMAAAKAAGLDHAIAADLNVVTPRAEAFAIPRLWVHDWDGAQFHKRLDRWL